MEFIRFSRHFGSGGNDFIIRNPFFLSRSDSPMYMEKKREKALLLLPLDETKLNALSLLFLSILK